MKHTMRVILVVALLTAFTAVIGSAASAQTSSSYSLQEVCEGDGFVVSGSASGEALGYSLSVIEVTPSGATTTYYDFDSWSGSTAVLGFVDAESRLYNIDVVIREDGGGLTLIDGLDGTGPSGLTIDGLTADECDEPPVEQVCPPLDSGKIDVSGENQTLEITAPDGYLIDEYCVKAGSANQGLGPEFVEVSPPQKTVVISHSSGKDISHYSVSYTEEPSTTTTTMGTTTTTMGTTTTTLDDSTTTTVADTTTTTITKVETDLPDGTGGIPAWMIGIALVAMLVGATPVAIKAIRSR